MQSDNKNEIQNFSKLADEWWKTDGKFQVLHQFNATRITYINHEIQQYSQNTNQDILDIGCGGGILAEPFAKQGFNVIGIDASADAIKVAQQHAEQSKLKISYINITPEQYLIQNPNQQFSIIFASEIIEHVNNPEYFIQTILKLLKPNGLLFISTINKNIQSLILAKYVAEYVLGWLPKNIHSYSKFITPKYLSDTLEKNNATIINIKGMKFNIFTKNWDLVKKPTINYICTIRKRNS